MLKTRKIYKISENMLSTNIFKLEYKHHKTKKVYLTKISTIE